MLFENFFVMAKTCAFNFNFIYFYFGIGNNVRHMVCQLHQLRLDIVSCFTGSGATYHNHVLVARIFPVLGPAVHGQGFRRCQDDVVIRDRINIGSDIFWSPP